MPKEPEEQREGGAEDKASDDGKVEGGVFAPVDDVAGEAAETEREFSAETEKRANKDEKAAEEEKCAPEFAKRVHPEILPEPAEKLFLPREAQIRSAGAGRTVAQVSVIGPKELHIYARRGAVLFSYRGESKTIGEGESYQVILDPAGDGSDKKQSAQKSGRQPRAFLLVAAGAGAGAAAAIVYEEHKHKQMESPDYP